MAGKRERLKLADKEGVLGAVQVHSVFSEPPGGAGCAECVVSLLSNARVT